MNGKKAEAKMRRRAVAGSPSSFIHCVEISSKLKDNLDIFKRLHGNRWIEVVADMGTALQLKMMATGETNPIAAAIPVAKAMSRDNQSPMLLLAVATDMALNKTEKLCSAS